MQEKTNKSRASHRQNDGIKITNIKIFCILLRKFLEQKKIGSFIFFCINNIKNHKHIMQIVDKHNRKF